MTGTSRMWLLDAYPELGEDMPADQHETARRTLDVPVIELDRGPWNPLELDEWPGVDGSVMGILVLEGSLTMGVAIGARACCRLLLEGDLLLMDGIEDDLIPLEWSWSVGSRRARMAVLDDRILAERHRRDRVEAPQGRRIRLMRGL